MTEDLEKRVTELEDVVVELIKKIEDMDLNLAFLDIEADERFEKERNKEPSK